jgi:alpha-soluble NSF attachment protein
MSAMAKAQKAKAETFVSAAEKTLAKKSWFGGFTGGGGREKNIEEACELLLQAANAYKVGGLNQEAGATYMRVGKLYQEMNSANSNSTNDAAKAYTQAGECC